MWNTAAIGFLGLAIITATAHFIDRPVPLTQHEIARQNLQQKFHLSDVQINGIEKCLAQSRGIDACTTLAATMGLANALNALDER